MSSGIALEQGLPPRRTVDLFGRHRSLLREAVREDGRDPPVEEVEHPIIDAAEAHPQLVDAVAEQVGLRPSEFVPELGEPLDAFQAFEPGPSGRWYPANPAAGPSRPPRSR